MSNYSNIKTLLDHLSNDDQESANDAFKGLIVDRIKEKIDVEKIRMAGEVYSEATAPKAEKTAKVDIEPIDPSENDGDENVKKASDPKAETPANVNIDPVDPDENDVSDDMKQSKEEPTKK